MKNELKKLINVNKFPLEDLMFRKSLVSVR